MSLVRFLEAPQAKQKPSNEDLGAFLLILNLDSNQEVPGSPDAPGLEAPQAKQKPLLEKEGAFLI